MKKRSSFRSSLLRGLGTVAALMIAAGAISPAFGAAPLTKAKVKAIAKRVANQQITNRAPGLSVANANALEGKPASAFASSTSEPHHEVGTAGEPSFGSGWANDNPGTTSAAFYKDPLGVVHLKGIVSASSAGSTIFTLPAGYRPTKGACFPTVRAVPVLSSAYVCVQVGGAVDLTGGAGDGTYLLDGLTFRAGAG
ncbi:MAG: hypothetical protein ACRDKA_10095 [Actinomycetota bacterium]